MADPLSTGFLFGGDTGLTYEELKRRRAIAAALASRGKGFPKNVGEGLTYLGESIGEAVGDWRLRQMEARQKAGDTAALTPPSAPVTPSVAPATPPPTSTPAPAPVEPPAPAPVSGGPGVFPDPAPTAAAAPDVPPDVVADTSPASFGGRFDQAFTSTAPVPEPPPAQQVAARFAPAMEQPLTRAMPRPNDLLFNPQMAQGGVQPDTSNLPAVSMDPRTAYSPQQAQATAEATARLNEPLSPVKPPPELAQNQQPAPQGPPAPPQGPPVPPPGGAGPVPPPPPAAAPAPPQMAAGPPPIEGPMPDPRSQARMAASRAIESGGNYGKLHAITKTGDRAHGAYGIMGKNIPGWTKDALGYPMTPEQFRGSQNAQDITFRNRFEGNYVPKYGEEGAARAWYAGETGMKNLGATDQHGRLTVAGYGRDFMKRLNGPQGDPGTQIVVRPPGNRDAITAAVMNQPQPPSDRELLSDALLAEVVGGNASQAPTSATASRGDVVSDAPDPGVGALTGSGIADTVKARRNAITNSIMQQQQQQPPPLPPEVPPDPTTPPSTPSISASAGDKLAQLAPGFTPGNALVPGGGVFPPPPAPPRDTSQGVRPIPAAPEPRAYPDPGPEPKPPGPTPDMDHYRRVAGDPERSDATRAEALRRYTEEKARQDAAFTRQWTRWNDADTKRRDYEIADPQRRQALQTTNLANEKALRDLEGEGFLPLTREEMASLPTPPAGQIIYKNRRGELKFGPTPPASTLVTVDQRAEGKGLEKMQQALGESFVKTYESGADAATDLTTLTELRKRSAGISTGATATVQQFLGRIGIKTEGLSDIQAYNAMINRLIPQQRVPGSGTTSDFDAGMFRDSLPTLMNTPGGNALIMNTMETLAKNKMDRAEVAGQVVAGTLTMKEGVQKMLELQQAARTASDNVKTFLEGKDASTRTPADNMALDWAKRNPDDPRALEIRKRLGIP